MSEVSQEVSRNTQQALQIAMQVMRFMEARKNKQLQQYQAELGTKIEENQMWLAANDKVLHTQVNLSDQDVWRELAGETDYRNMYGVCFVQSSNPHLGTQDKKFYQENGARLLKEGQTKGWDLEADCKNMGNTIKLRDAKVMSRAWMAELVGNVRENGLLEVPPDTQEPVVTISEDAEIADSEEMNRPTDQSAFGAASEDILKKASDTATEPPVAAPVVEADAVLKR
jgi:hypothetical protein